MAIIGQIEADAGIDRDAWIELIASDSRLSKVPSRKIKAINPFTRKSFEFRSAAFDTSADVSMNGEVIGSIFWALDESAVLIVETGEEDDDEDATVDFAPLAEVAEAVASKLGGRFVRQIDEF